MRKHPAPLSWSTTALLLAVCGHSSTARADIYQWHYINDNPFLNVEQSTTLCPDGAGVNASRGANLSHRDLTKAWLEGTSLTGASAIGTNLTNADMEASFLKDVNM